MLLTDSKTNDYQKRINLVVNHIAANLDTPHSIEQLAEVAHSSKFHFHRLFRALTGETVQGMVARLRLERTAATLIYQQNRSITQVALDHGYSSSANFTKAFTKHFGCSPSVYRKEQFRQPKNSKIGKDAALGITDHNQIELQVSVNQQAETQLAYLRNKGRYRDMDIGSMHRRVWQWAADNKCMASEPTCIGITWSDSHIVDEENWIYDACIAVQPGTTADDAVGIQTLSAGLIAQVEVELEQGDSHDLSPYWDWFVGAWFVSSGYELRLSPSYELYIESDQRFVVRLCLPLESSTRRK